MDLQKNMEYKANIIYWLRWILVLPTAATTCYGIGTVVIFASLFFMYMGIPESVVTVFVEFSVVIVSPVLTIIVGTLIAPRHRLITAMCLGVLWTAYDSSLTADMVLNIYYIESAARLIIVHLLGVCATIICCFCIKLTKLGRT